MKLNKENGKVIMKMVVANARDCISVADDFYAICGRETKLDLSDTLVFAYDGSSVVGIVRLCFEDKSYVLRTMQIHPDHQRKGIGSLILKRFDELLIERKISEIFCMPYEHLEGFYGQIGFSKLPVEKAPVFLRKRLKVFFQKKPNEKAILMVRAI